MKNTVAVFSLFLASFCLSINVAMAQKTTVTTPKPFVEESSAEAKALFASLKKKYVAMAGMQVNYTLVSENGDNVDKQTGVLYQSGNKYRLAMGANEVISDGKAVWTYQKSANEVQISDFDPNDEDLLAPNNLLNFSETEKKFYYEITGEDATAIYLEFKPLDKKTEYSKLRFKVSKKTNELQEIKVFTKNSMRYTLSISKLIETTIAAPKFTFDKAAYPGVKVVDLRD